MNHYRWSEITLEQMNPLFTRSVIHGDHLTLARVYLKKGCKVPLHHHDNEQMSNVLSGSLLFQIGGEERIVKAGEVVHIPSGVPHLAEALEDTECLDIFNPTREDWIRGDDAYLRG